MARGFPFYQQLDAMDCGAACLRMIAKHYGRVYNLDYLRELTFMGKQGVSLLEVSDAAEHIGLQTLAVETNYDQLISVIPLPCIAHWKNDHFVVVYRADKHFVWVADPASAKYKLTKTEFLQRWVQGKDGGEQGIALLLQTTPEFLKHRGEEIDKGKISFVLHYFKRYQPLILQLLIGVFLGTILQVLFPFLIKGIVDVGIATNDIDFIYLILIAQLLIYGTQISVEYIRSWILLHVGVRVNISLISDYLIKLTKLPLRFFDSRLAGDLVQRVNDHERVQRFLSSTSLLSLFSLLNLIAFAGVLWYWNLTVFLLYTIGAGLNVAWVMMFNRWRRDLDYKRFDQSAENQTNLMELIYGMQDIKMFNAEKQKRWAWERVQSQLFRTGISNLKLTQVQKVGAISINEIKNLVIVYFVAKAVINTDMTLGMLVAIQYIIGQLNSQINQLLEFLFSYHEASISLARMNEIHVKKDEENQEEKITILPEYGDITLDNVSFQYSGPNSPYVLRNVRLQIPKGKVTAIVGRSGSGKTTLLKLLLNFYPPSEGIIRIGDVNLAGLSNKLWRSKCGVVMQEGFIFSDTIARNIALGDEIIDKNKLLTAVKVANIQGFIESLDMGYNTRIGQNGMGLSQGQKQRVLIARAVYKNPEYLFFDEATTALDSFNEMVIMENLMEYFNRKTVVLVAHRLSTIKHADSIIVLEDGEIVEQGTHEELTYTRKAYYQLVRNQIELGA
ncbi:MAG: Toxin RTX-I translocation ATP-binding protein [Haliscomenobacter sp.]|jgi:ATP-binding cassette subfamily B protein|nr:Toxin RTX-I translocation ATP-binding protein [Haliscomenobacter sp.]